MSQQSSTTSTRREADDRGRQGHQMIASPSCQDFEDIERSPDVDVAGLGVIRGYNYRDAGRGVNLDAGQKNNRQLDANNFATAFPAPSIRAASWDLDLEMRVGEAIGDETVGSLNNMLLAPCMHHRPNPTGPHARNVRRRFVSKPSPGDGARRFASTARGRLRQHYAPTQHSKSLARRKNAIMTEQTLRENFARHFEMVVQDGGVGCIMASVQLITASRARKTSTAQRDLEGTGRQRRHGLSGHGLPTVGHAGDQERSERGQALSDARGGAGRPRHRGAVDLILHLSRGPGRSDRRRKSARRVLTQKFRSRARASRTVGPQEAPVDVERRLYRHEHSPRKFG